MTGSLFSRNSTSDLSLTAHQDSVRLCLANGLVLVMMLLLSLPVTANAQDELMVADMEGKTKFTTFPQTDSPVAHGEIVDSTAASGDRSLRFEYNADGKRPASLVLPFDKSIADYDVLSFDMYTKSRNGSRFIVTVHAQSEGQDPSEMTEYIGRVDLKEGRDGWITIQLVKDRSLVKRVDSKKGNWANPRAISFAVNKSGKGPVEFYIDNVRFLKADEGLSRNMMYNGSFEIATNPDAPDGWRRGFFEPPYGSNIWTLDTNEKWHGNSSLRLGHEGVMASAWGRFVSLVPSEFYTYSVYLKADRKGVKAELEINGLDKPNTIEVTTDTTWKRYELTGKAFRTRTNLVIRQKSPGVLWIDAAQLEQGEKASEYYFPLLDQQELKAATSVVTEKPSSLNDKIRETAITRLSQAPVIDGKLDDSCWQSQPNMTGFRELAVDQPSSEKTQAWVAYDDTAIYLAVRAYDNDMSRVRRLLSDPKSAWTADNIEILIDTNNDRNSYHHFVVNPVNLRWYRYNRAPRKGTRWQSDWTSATSMNDDSWTAEIRIPYTSFKHDELSEVMGINVTRSSKVKPERDGTVYSAWSYPHGGFQAPRAFGSMTGFDTSVLQPFRLQVVSAGWTQGNAHARLENLTDHTVNLKAIFNVTGSQNVQSKPMDITIAKGEIKDILIPLELKQDGSYAVALQALDTSGVKRVQSQSMSFSVSGANKFVFDGPEFAYYTQGEPIQVRAVVNLNQDQIKDHLIRWELAGQKGAFDAKPGVNSWKINASKIKNGSHEIKTTLLRKDDVVAQDNTSLDVVPASPHFVRMNRWGQFFEVDGKPFYPFGFFTETLYRTHDLNVWRQVVAEMKSNNCNSVVAYMGLRTDLPENLGQYLDAADEAGVKVFVEISTFFIWDIPKVKGVRPRYTDKETALADMKKTIAKYRDHPALLGWCAFDEPGNRPDLFTGKVVAEASTMIKSEDPYHPFFCTHLNHVGDAKIYGPAVDLGLMPFVASGGRYDDMFRDLRDAKLPVMVNSPAYGAAGNSKHEPAIAQQRVNTYKGILMGAAGTQYYLFRPASELLWRSMGQINVELQTLAPAIFSTELPLPLQVTPLSQDQLVVLKRNGDDYYLMAVNMDVKSQELVVDLLSLDGIEQVESLLDSPSVSHQGKQARLTFTISGQGTAFYKFKSMKD